MAQFETWLKSDLQQPVKVIAVHGNVFTQDNMANRVGVEVTDGGEAVNLSGSVQGYIIRADDATVVQTGSLSGNKAWVDLPESAYAVPGQIQIAIRLVSGQTKTVLGACTGYVVMSVTSTIIDPGEVVPDIADLLAMIAECEAATDGAENVNIAQTKAGNDITITTTDRDGVQTANTISGGSPVITDTASGAIASFPDGADNEPMESVKVGIEPVQDLHGYANPWPAGGGKNKHKPYAYNASSANVSVTYAADGSVTLNGTSNAGGSTPNIATARQNGFLYTIPAGTYKPSLSGTATNIAIQVYRASDSTSLSTGEEFTISEPTEILFRVGVNANKTYNNQIAYMQLESGSTATTYAPYSNICPITGWTGANVSRTGANLYSRGNGQYNVPVYSADGTSASYPDVNAVWIKVKPSTTYHVTCLPPSKLFYVRWINCDKNKGFISRPGPSYTSANLPRDFTTTSETHWVEVACNQNGADAIPSNNWELCVSETATTYVPYSGTIFPITWTEAGTVYGGELDVTTGVLTVDRAIYTFTGNETQYIQQTNRVAINCGNSMKTAHVICSHFANVETAAVRYAYIPTALTAEELKTFMQNNTVTMAYYLATPVTYHLTPTQITSLLGQNNVWADTGDIAVTYKADTKLYIDKKLSALIAQIVNA